MRGTQAAYKTQNTAHPPRGFPSFHFWTTSQARVACRHQRTKRGAWACQERPVSHDDTPQTTPRRSPPTLILGAFRPCSPSSRRGQALATAVVTARPSYEKITGPQTRSMLSSGSATLSRATTPWGTELLRTWPILPEVPQSSRTTGRQRLSLRSRRLLARRR